MPEKSVLSYHHRRGIQREREREWAGAISIVLCPSQQYCTAKGDVLTYRQTNKRITRDQEKGGRGREGGRKGGDVFHCGTGTSTAADNTKGYACVANLVDSAQTRGSLFLQSIVPKRIALAGKTKVKAQGSRGE